MSATVPTSPKAHGTRTAKENQSGIVTAIFPATFGENGDVTTDFYHRYPKDISLMAKLGIRHFRMSIAWTRIIPDGTGAVNPMGIAFYHRVLDELNKYGIEPMVTIYMWDLPQKLQDIGGWGNRLTADAYDAYAKLLFREYGNKVKTWVTFDEPFCGAFIGNYLGTYAPGLRDFNRTTRQLPHAVGAWPRRQSLPRDASECENRYRAQSFRLQACFRSSGRY